MSVALLIRALAVAILGAAFGAGQAHAAGTLTITGVSGTGTVTGPGINCTTGTTGDCTEFYDDEQECIEREGKPPICFNITPEVTVSATPGTHYAFDGWGGDCAGEPADCTLTMSGNRSANVMFRDASPPPTVALTKPEMTWWTQEYWRETVELEASASANTGIQRVEFLVDGAVVGSDTSAPYQHSFNTKSRPDGPVPVAVRAFGNSGKSATTTVEVKIDNTAPAITTSNWIARPTRGNEVLGRVRITDDGWLYGNDYCYFDGDESNGGYCLDAGVRKEEEGNYWLERTDFEDGQHTITIRSADAAGNVGSATRTFVFDATAPETTIASGPANGSTTAANSASFGFAANEGATFECRLYAVGAEEPEFDDCSGPGATHSRSDLAPGMYRFEVRATDAAGNQEGSPAGRTFTLTAPAKEPEKRDPDPRPQPPRDPDPIQQPQQPQQNQQQEPAQPSKPAKRKPGKCSKLKGKKRSACIKKSCGKLNKKKTQKRYKACVKKVVRK
jgi:hypothetical protein